MTAAAGVRRVAGPRAALLPVALGVATVALQVAYPLVEGPARTRLTVTTVLVFAAASVSHAATHRGARWASGYLAVTAGVGLLAEAVGTATGFPFGAYRYAPSLGAQLLGVPVVVPLAWAMFAYPCLLVGQRLRPDGVGATLVGAWALASWDLFLDPQMVSAGHWRWAAAGPVLPGGLSIPVTNSLGWLAVGVVMLGALQRLGRRAADDRVPAGLFLWTYGSSVLAAAVFFDRPEVALLGGTAMGLVAVPYALALRGR